LFLRAGTYIKVTDPQKGPMIFLVDHNLGRFMVHNPYIQSWPPATSLGI
jgi:hypothetical protein